MRRALFLAIIGLGGAAILLALGVWQVQRLNWKQGVLADIDARITAAAVALPDTPDPQAQGYLPVTVTGRYTGPTLRVLVSQRVEGAGHRLITPMDTGGRRILIDRGFLAVADTAPPPPAGEVTITGNLQWPDEVDSFTPAPDADSNLIYARDVPYMADRLQTEPILLVARDVTPPEAAVTPLPVDTSRIPNNHLQYAVTWFSLAAIWLAMSLAFALRRRAGSSKG